MNCEYQRDLMNHFLIITAENSNTDTYELPMLERNDIRRILSCQIRYRGTKRQYCYEINGKQTMKQLYALKKMSYSELKQLFYEIEAILEEVKKYLLKDSRLLLDLDYIYREIGKDECFFLYFPESGEDMGKQVQTLAEELLEMIDYEDEQAVSTAYEFYRCAGEDTFTFSHIIEYMQEMICSESRDSYESIEESAKIQETKGEEKQEQEPEKESRKIFLPEFGKIGKAAAATALFLCALLIYLIENYEFSPAEITAMAAVLTAVILGAAGYVGKKLSGKRKAGEERKEAVTEIKAEEEPIMPEKAAGYEETTFFEMEDWEQERVLEGRIRGRHIVIKIDSTPFVIGKLEGSVSYILQDSSISRIHAKIAEEEGKLYLYDLNSKNGTFKNGVQLSGGDRSEVSRGDEIRFGRLRFTYY